MCTKYVHAPAADVKALYESGAIKDETVIRKKRDFDWSTQFSTFSKVKDEYMGKHVHKHTCVCKRGYETTDFQRSAR